MFKRLLIANRGEIACRIARTARRLGIPTVAVYSDADRDALFVREADHALRIGPAPARESYLSIDALTDAVRRSGADAVHPGYGFLAENGDFAAACGAAGCTFVGPSADAIRAMGAKIEAKRIVAAAGTPVVPGFFGSQESDELAAQAAQIGYPLLIKASAGGGGKGMRVVRAADEFPIALAGARREAKAAFGDDAVLLEKYLCAPKHIEVQVLADSHGRTLYLFERDCSVQRRHQKVIEEAPAPTVTQAQRAQMGEAAVRAAAAIGYLGAGTIEFIADASGFYFMEMNTRLQVEHPVTEMITGVDLVEWQLRVAAGEALPCGQNALSIRGHSIEARIYAEDPARNFLPQTGRIVHLAFPAASGTVRIDSGVESGMEISPYYDPMIAKLIVWGPDRESALARLRAALAATEIAGPRTNVVFLQRIASCAPFSQAVLDTGLIERNRETLFPAPAGTPREMLAGAAYAELALEQEAAHAQALASGDPHSPWHLVDGWRLNEDSHHDFVFLEGDIAHAARVRFLAEEMRIEIDGEDHSFGGERLDDGRLLVRLDGNASKLRAVREGNVWHLFSPGEYRRFALRDELQGLDEEAESGSRRPCRARSSPSWRRAASTSPKERRCSSSRP